MHVSLVCTMGLGNFLGKQPSNVDSTNIAYRSSVYPSEFSRPHLPNVLFCSANSRGWMRDIAAAKTCTPVGATRVQRMRRPSYKFWRCTCVRVEMKNKINLRWVFVMNKTCICRLMRGMGASGMRCWVQARATRPRTQTCLESLNVKNPRAYFTLLIPIL